ncbi:MAG: hypothetical protein HC917_06310 [Richelia sp. SM2_1_7]|nr:hypothetical protein [Richelia sp. SM2_1_7]
MTERISKAIDVLLDAVNNRTLAKGTCTACAVGNLIAAGLGEKVYARNNNFYCNVVIEGWRNLFLTNNYGLQFIDKDFLKDKTLMKKLMLQVLLGKN